MKLENTLCVWKESFLNPRGTTFIGVSRDPKHRLYPCIACSGKEDYVDCENFMRSKTAEIEDLELKMKTVLRIAVNSPEDQRAKYLKSFNQHQTEYKTITGNYYTIKFN